MKFSSIRLSGMLATAIVIAIAGAVEASAQTADVAGAWTFTVTTAVTGTSTPAVRLEQDGETLTGHYSSENLGEADLTGTVSGSEITFTFSPDALGELVEVIYSRTVNEDSEISGTLDIGGGLLTGTFTAGRTEA